MPRVNRRYYKVPVARFFQVLLLFMLVSCIRHSDPILSQTNLIQSSLEQWSSQVFNGQTEYKTAYEHGHWVLHARSKGTASAIYRLHEVNLHETPFLNWDWRVNEFSHQSDQYVRSGDDFSARIYVVYRKGLIPTQGYAINFVWSNDEQLNSWANPFSDHSMMVALQRRSVGEGVWRSEKVNIQEHFKTAFDLEVEEIHVIAIMSDSDNGGGSSSASFANLFFSED